MLQYFTLFFPNVTRRAEGCDDIRASGYLTSDQRDSNFRERLNKAERDFHTSVITEHHLPPEIHTHLHTLSLSEKRKKKTLWIPSPGYRPHFTHYNIWMSRKCVSHFPSLSTGVMEKTGKLFIISVCRAQQTHNLLLVFFHSVGIRHWGNTQDFFFCSLLSWHNMTEKMSFWGFWELNICKCADPKRLRQCEKRQSGLKTFF